MKIIHVWEVYLKYSLAILKEAALSTALSKLLKLNPHWNPLYPTQKPSPPSKNPPLPSESRQNNVTEIC